MLKCAAKKTSRYIALHGGWVLSPAWRITACLSPCWVGPHGLAEDNRPFPLADINCFANYLNIGRIPAYRNKSFRFALAGIAYIKYGKTIIICIGDI